MQKPTSPHRAARVGHLLLSCASVTAAWGAATAFGCHYNSSQRGGASRQLGSELQGVCLQLARGRQHLREARLQ